MIKEAQETGDDELLEKVTKYCLDFWQHVLSQQHDLVHYSHFSYSDVEIMPVVERDKFLEFSIEKEKLKNENLVAIIAKLFGG